MYTPAVGPAAAAPSPPSTQMRGVNESQFMQLLVTQLQHQDPLHPADDQSMLAQLAQFSALEQMQAIAQAGRQQNAFTLLGRQVTALSSSGDPVTGTVAGVRVSGSSVQLDLGDAGVVDAATIQAVTR